MSDQVILALIGTLNAVLTAAVAALAAYFNAKLNKIANVGIATHALANSSTQAQLALNASTSRRLAIAEPTPENKEDAELAAKVLEDHKRGQTVVDSLMTKAEATGNGK